MVPKAGTKDRARYDMWCFWCMTELDCTLYVYRKHAEADAGGLAELYGSAPAAIEAAAEYFVKQLAVAVAELRRTGAYLLGAEFSAADVLLTSCLEWAKRIGWLPARADGASIRVIEQYLALVTGRKAYAEAQAMLSG